MKWLKFPALGIVEVLALQTAGVLAMAWLFWPAASDVDIYFRYSEQVLDGQVPYRDFPFEYPPLALVPLLLPRLAVFLKPIGVQDYYALFLCLNVALSVATGACVAWIGIAQDSRARLEATKDEKASHQGHAPQAEGPDHIAGVAVYSMLAVISVPVLCWRYDAFPAILTALGLLALVKHRPGLAGTCLGLGTVAKIYPMFLIALFAAYYLAAGDRRGLARLVAASVTVAALVMLPFRLLAPDQWLYFLAYHRERGFEIGSTVAAALWLAGVLGLAPMTTEHVYGGRHIVSPIADALLPWAPPVLLLAVGGVVLLYLERFRMEREKTGSVRFQSLATATAVMLLVFIIVNKVFSPQYIVWLIPFVPVLPARAIALFGGISVLTIYVYPFHWLELLDGHLAPTLALNCRNLLVLVLIFVLWFSRLPRGGRVPQGH
jgi:hypothetical protein